MSHLMIEMIFFFFCLFLRCFPLGTEEREERGEVEKKWRRGRKEGERRKNEGKEKRESSLLSSIHVLFSCFF